ncbi:MAG: GNAT family N-acetyltransferase [Anaerolineae bacterium]|nr:GNAT family N-acetyltransferase [Anaerolineae bacterium]
MSELHVPVSPTGSRSDLPAAMPQVIIRAMRSEDLPALEWDGEFTHFRAVYQKVYDRMLEGTALMWVMEFPERELIGQAFVQLKDPVNQFFTPDGRQAYIHSFRIRPAFRSVGLGSRLLDFIEADLVERGFQFAALNVGLTNHGAKRLYTRKGYRVVGRDSGNWSYHDHEGILRRVSEPGWNMRKKLLF